MTAPHLSTQPPADPIDTMSDEEVLDAMTYAEPALPRPAAPAGPALTLYSLEELAALPPAPWLVEGLLPAGGTAVLYGKRGSFKTFIAIDLARHVAAGLEWHGRHTEPAHVVYVAAEGRGGITTRMLAWAARHGNHTEPLVHAGPLSLLTATNGDRLVAALLDAFGSEAADLPLLLVFDTLHRSIPGGDENDSATPGQVYATLDVVRQAFPLMTALLVHHPTKNPGAETSRGSSAWEDDADTVLRLERDGEGHTVTLRCTKQKDAEEFAPITLELETEGESLVVAPTGWAVPRPETLTSGEREALARLTDFHPEAISWTRWREVAGCGDSSLARHRRRLIALGYVEAIPTGSKQGRQAQFRYGVTGAGIAAGFPPASGSRLPPGALIGPPEVVVAGLGYRGSRMVADGSMGAGKPDTFEPVDEGYFESLLSSGPPAPGTAGDS